jgi:hypothetical protein
MTQLAGAYQLGLYLHTNNQYTLRHVRERLNRMSSEQRATRRLGEESCSYTISLDANLLASSRCLL